MNKKKRINQLFADPELSSTTKLIYLYMIRYKNEFDFLRLDCDKAMNTLYIGKGTFRRSLLTLKERGYISCTTIFKDENGELKKDITFL